MSQFVHSSGSDHDRHRYLSGIGATVQVSEILVFHILLTKPNFIKLSRIQIVIKQRQRLIHTVHTLRQAKATTPLFYFVQSNKPITLQRFQYVIRVLN